MKSIKKVNLIYSLIFAFLSLSTVSAVHISNVSVTPQIFNTNQSAIIEFTINITGDNLTRVDIHTAPGWSNTAIISCPPEWENSTTPAYIRCNSLAGGPTYKDISIRILSKSPSTGKISSWTIITKDAMNDVETTTVNVTLYNISYTAEISPKSANTNQKRAYIMAVKNTGEDNITYIKGEFSDFTITACYGLNCNFYQSNLYLFGNLEPTKNLTLMFDAIAPNSNGTRNLNIVAFGSLGGNVTAIPIPIIVQKPANLTIGNFSFSKTTISVVKDTASFLFNVTNNGEAVANITYIGIDIIHTTLQTILTSVSNITRISGANVMNSSTYFVFNYSLSPSVPESYKGNITVIVKINYTDTNTNHNFPINKTNERAFAMVVFPLPNITLNFPLNNYNIINTTPNFNFTAISAVSSLMTCNLLINSTYYGRISALNNTPTIITANSTVYDGQYSWWISCSDAFNTGLSMSRIINVDGPPRITVNSPKENQIFYNTTPILDVSISDRNPWKSWYNIDNSSLNYLACSYCNSFNIKLEGERQTDIDGYTKGLWHFNENTGTATADPSGYGNNGLIHNATWTTGKFNSGLQFDGVDDFVDVGNAANINLIGSVSVEAWIYPKANNSVIYEDSDSANSPTLVLIFDTNNKFSFRRHDGAWKYATSSSPYSVNKWYHVVGVFDAVSGKHTIYVNGIDTVGDVSIGTLSSSAGRNVIGIDSRFNTAYGIFNGIIDEVRILNKSLTAIEIKKNYELGEGRHNVTVYTNDIYGNTNSVNRNFKIILTPPIIYNITLYKGWNLISLPVLMNEV